MMSESQKIISVMLAFFVGMFILTSISDEVSKKKLLSRQHRLIMTHDRTCERMLC